MSLVRFCTNEAVEQYGKYDPDTKMCARDQISGPMTKSNSLGSQAKGASLTETLGAYKDEISSRIDYGVGYEKCTNESHDC